MAGLAGDATVQYIQMVVNGNTQKDWGPQGSETQSRAMLVFFDGAGNQVGEFKFPHDPPAGANTVLIATEAFTNRTGIRADIIMPPLIQPGSGKVCFKRNPANPLAFSVNLCLSYGSFPANLTEGAGPPAPALPIMGDPAALVRFQNFVLGDGSSRNADFRLGIPGATNTLGQVAVLPGAGPEITAPLLVDFGRQLMTDPPGIRPVSIQNIGMTNSLIVSNVTLLGADAGSFLITNDSGQTVLGPNATRTVTVAFQPDTTGRKTAQLRIVSNDADEGIVNVTLQGDATDANPCSVPILEAALAADSCSDAQFVRTGFLYTGTTTNATLDGASTCVGLPGPDVWYRYMASVTGTLTVQLTGLNFPAAISFHRGCPGVTTNQIACGTGSALSTGVTNGQEVLIRITGNSGSSGNFQMLLSGPASINFDRNTNGVSDLCELDFGDAPGAGFATLRANTGAVHIATSGLFLGRNIDTEHDGQPTPLANGDNLDGPQNDDDGVTFATPLTAGQGATVSVVATVPAQTTARLNGWIDFNSDRDWADVGEQVFVNRILVPGTNTLTFTVPSTATPTNLTFARFRLSSSTTIGIQGLALDGEVEDYAVEILPVTQVPGQLGVRINEVMAGLSGDSSVQFVELQVSDEAQKLWGPQGSESVGRAMLVFYNAVGTQIGRFIFPSNAPPGADTVLVATRAFADQTGLEPDFIMPPELMAVSGKVAFRNNPDNSHFNINVALAYGGNGYFGLTDGAGAANINQLPIVGARSLTRTENFPFGLNRNRGFQLLAPTPSNAATQTVALAAGPLVEQGRQLFMKETFAGNGRTCASCHVPGRDQFGLTGATIAAMDHDDPLFVFEENVNLLKLIASSQPGDLRGPLTATSGTAKILAGSGDSYLILGGTNLSGTITDTNGNSGQFQAVTEGDLNRPTMSNGSPMGLEDHDLLRHGRALVLENIDGFQQREVFRMSPHLLNLALTAPYGLSGEFSNLRDFSAGAVVQHFPRSLARIDGVDFRRPTPEELIAMEVFQNSIFNPVDQDFDLDRFATTEAQKRGRSLFFGDQSLCFKCHSGPVLAFADGSLPGTVAGRNENFNTGVANRLITRAGLPTEPAGLTPGQSTRKFNTPPLFGIKLTGPYFHDGSAANLTEAVEFYDSVEFVASPDGQNVGAVIAANDPQKVADIVAFLESLVEIPVAFPRDLVFNTICDGEPAVRFANATITNTGPDSLAISSVTINGTNAAAFGIITDSGETNLAPGATRTVQIGFTPLSLGRAEATLEITATDNDLLGTFSFGVSLKGANVDNVAAVGPAALNFVARDIDDPPSVTQTVGITNFGSIGLEIFQVELAGTNAADFVIVSDSGETNLAPGAVRSVNLAFAPQTRGPKLARLHIEALACDGAVVDVALTGIATSSPDRFVWDAVGSPQTTDALFPVAITALDRNGEPVPEYVGIANLSASVTNPPAGPVLIAEIDPGTPDAVELVNISTQSVTISSWQVVFYDEVSFPNPVATLTIPGSTTVPPNGIFRVTENGTAPGAFPNFFTGNNLFWTGDSTRLAVALRNSAGVLVDFVTTGSSASISNPVAVPVTQWNGAGIPAEAVDDSSSYQRTGVRDRNNALDWIIAARNVGTNNPGLASPFPAIRPVAISPAITEAFTNGAWAGQVTVHEELRGIRLVADDGAGHTGATGLFDVFGAAPTITGLVDLTIDEDTVSPLMPFTVGDAEQLAENLIVSSVVSNTTLIPAANVVLGGAGSNRTVRVTPAANQSGSAEVTVRVSDGVQTNSASFTVTVNPVNDPPVMPAIANRTVNEHTLLSFTITATDVDSPPGGLTFDLLAAPPGASINPTNGLFTWTPTEEQGPSTTNPVTVRVTDAGVPFLSVTQSFNVTVLEVNAAPLLTAIPDQAIFGGTLFAQTNTASDPDIPPNLLTFSLVTLPAGMTINATNGVVNWVPAVGQTPSTNLVRVRVADNGSPSLSATQSFNLTVLQRPATFTTSLNFGVLCNTSGPPPTLALIITNSSSNTVTIADVAIVGTDADAFSLLAGQDQPTIAPLAILPINVAFTPASLGSKQARVRVELTSQTVPIPFAFEVPLNGAFLDNVVTAGPAQLVFAPRSINDPPSLAQTVNVTNQGSLALEITGVALAGADTADFLIASDTGQTNLPPDGVRAIQLLFSPRTRGAKSAVLRIDSQACSGSGTEVALAGAATSTLNHFGWDMIASPQSAHVPFAVKVAARDVNGHTVDEFTGTVSLSGGTNLTLPGAVLISEIDPGTPDAAEFVNVTTLPVDVSGWQVTLYENLAAPLVTITLPPDSILPPGGVFTVQEFGTPPGVFPSMVTGANINWVSTQIGVAVLLRDAAGNIVDFATTGTSASITNPVTIPTNHWSGPGITTGPSTTQSYQRRGTNDNNNSTDWIVTTRDLGSNSPVLLLPFDIELPTAVTFSNQVAFAGGFWEGMVTIPGEIRDLMLLADDKAGHTGLSNPFNVVSAPPVLSSLADLATDEDTPTPPIAFTVSDDVTPAASLIVTGASSNTNLVPAASIVFAGTGSNRTVTLFPATNQSGTATITLNVSDGVATNSGSFVLTVNPVNDPPTLAVSAPNFQENFDGVTAPGLPAGWTTATTGVGVPWVTSTTQRDTLPNAAFTPNPSSTSSSHLESPSVFVGSQPAQMAFRHSFATESCCDGGFIELSINGGAFVNLTSAGGSFVTNGYNSGSSWRGSSGGFITSVANLPPAVAGQNVKFRWRFTTDGSVGGTGWFVDSISIASGSTSAVTNNENTPIVLVIPVSDVDTPVAALVLTGTSSNPALVPDQNIVVSGTSSNRTVTITPATNQSGTATIDLHLSDGELTTMQPVTVTFLPVNDPPVLLPIGDRIVDEGSTLSVVNSAVDPEVPPQVLTFALLTAPAGSAIDPATGLFTWTPSESQGPGLHPVSVRVTDNGAPPLSATQSFVVLVREVNSAPALAGAAARSMYLGETLTITNVAVDPDVPVNTLTFSLLSPPAGAVINAFSGVFNWMPAASHLGVNPITVRVQDNGTPSLSDTNTFAITVLPGPVIQSITVSEGLVTIGWEAIPGRTYQLQFKSDLAEAAWTPLPGSVIATGEVASATDASGGSAQRFYRVIVLP